MGVDHASNDDGPGEADDSKTCAELGHVPPHHEIRSSNSEPGRVHQAVWPGSSNGFGFSLPAPNEIRCEAKGAETPQPDRGEGKKSRHQEIGIRA